jgi:hypothetical protein
MALDYGDFLISLDGAFQIRPYDSDFMFLVLIPENYGNMAYSTKLKGFLSDEYYKVGDLYKTKKSFFEQMFLFTGISVLDLP